MECRIGRSCIDGEDIQVEAEAIDVLALLLHADGPAVHDLGIAGDESCLRRIGVVQKSVGTTVAIECQEPFKIRAGHHDINVVIPWDETFVADGSEQGAIGEGIADSLLPAEVVHIDQDIEQDRLDLLQIQLFHSFRFVR